MAITCAITSNGEILPKTLLPVGRDRLLITVRKRMASGQLRATVVEKTVLRYSGEELTETERSTWFTAHPRTTSFTHVDERGVSRTVVLNSITEQLIRTVPDVEGAEAPSGDGFYRVDVEVEEV